MTLLVPQLLLFLVCLVGSAFYAGIETGVISINRIRLRHHARAGVPAARILQDFLDKPDRLLGTTLLGNNLCNVMASIAAASIAMHFSRTWGPTISAGIATIVLLIFGEYLPKSWFRAMPYVRCSRFAHILYVNWLIARPLVTIVTWVARFIAPGPRRSAEADAGFVTKDEIKMLAREGATGGALSSRERDMIHSVMEMSRTQARAVLVPRARMTIAPQDITVRDFRALSPRIRLHAHPAVRCRHRPVHRRRERVRPASRHGESRRAPPPTSRGRRWFFPTPCPSMTCCPGCGRPGNACACCAGRTTGSPVSPPPRTSSSKSWAEKPSRLSSWNASRHGWQRPPGMRKARPGNESPATPVDRKRPAGRPCTAVLILAPARLRSTQPNVRRIVEFFMSYTDLDFEPPQACLACGRSLRPREWLCPFCDFDHRPATPPRSVRLPALALLGVGGLLLFFSFTRREPVLHPLGSLPVATSFAEVWIEGHVERAAHTRTGPTGVLYLSFQLQDASGSVRAYTDAPPPAGFIPAKGDRVRARGYVDRDAWGHTRFRLVHWEVAPAHHPARTPPARERTPDAAA
jgi:hypothetical protein